MKYLLLLFLIVTISTVTFAAVANDCLPDGARCHHPEQCCGGFCTNGMINGWGNHCEGVP
uniref:Ptu1-like peptide pp7 n=1 Tax=Pristhesancus plagipennis TaxID=1955184 RepID=A0A1Q1NP73_PRIPG|nr:ptu1-like peptide pp7 [Pristhesancus plagipennis]